jgi:hypothetical protein
MHTGSPLFSSPKVGYGPIEQAHLGTGLIEVRCIKKIEGLAKVYTKPISLWMKSTTFFDLDFTP